MKLDEFKYDLPAELIAQFPAAERAAARLMVVDRTTGQITHAVFSRITEWLAPDDVLILNDTRVFKARLIARRETGGRAELLLLRQTGHDTWDALISHAKRVRAGARLWLDRATHVTVVEKRAGGRIVIRFSADAATVIGAHGSVPLPPYIRRPTAASDEAQYQTVFARQEGSIAAPTAGLHFTPDLLERIGQRMQIGQLTLHIGPGTFKPVRDAQVEAHRMDAEYYTIPTPTLSLIGRAGRVVGVGTSVCRALETHALTGRTSGWADLFIYPGFRFKVVGRLITNFHLPASTPLLLVCAFAGKDLIFRAYEEAVAQKYRFLSYGDAMLIL